MAVSPLAQDDLVKAASDLKHPLLPPVTIGQDGSLTPQAAAVVAVLQNPALRAARSKRGVASAQLLAAGILPNPQLSASLDFPSDGSTAGAVTAYGLGATWDVTALVGREQARNAASREAESVNLDITWQEWQAAMGAKLHATRVLWLQRQKDLLDQQVSQAQEREQAATENLRAGLTTVIDSEAAGAALQKRRAALLTTEATLISELAMLREALGVPPDAPVLLRMEANAPALPTPSDLDSWVSQGRVDLAALQAAYQSQESKLHGAVLSQFPKIGLGITKARDTSNVGTIGFGITLDLPIFDRAQGRIAVEGATRQQLFDELAARTFEARADAHRALEELLAIQPQIDEARRTAERLQSLADKLAQARAAGDADVIQLAQAQNDAADAAVDLIHLEQQHAELRIALEVATGCLLGGTQP